ncbi:hypothetical protein CVIC8964_1312 [Campylobacter vicugnae]|uniref:Uncharacterized protein n=1 Tax=Campylobacter vicugnae TaxID=1660076 RepID=A0A1X9T2K1_9BACT|nr:hypothetical protein [Campylobacter sp. RM8964]ARR02701.1 hypothetical protein CVIC8964_1312 [Campylobacter sp. RM8964]
MLDTENKIFVVLDSKDQFIGTYKLGEITRLYLKDSSFKEKIDNKSFKVYVQDDEKFFDLLKKGLGLNKMLEKIAALSETLSYLRDKRLI